MATAIAKDQYRNASDHLIGVTTVTERGEKGGIPVHPGERVWLSQEERVLTANAPSRSEDNPFANGDLVYEDSGNRPAGTSERPIGEEVGTSVETSSTLEAAGHSSELEEVATPQARKKTLAPRAPRSRAKTKA